MSLARPLSAMLRRSFAPTQSVLRASNTGARVLSTPRNFAHKVLIPTRLDGVAKSFLESKDFEVVQDSETPLEELAKTHQDATALIVRSEKITEELITSFPSLKLIVRAGAGYNTIDTTAARKHNVDVMNTPGANANAVAEEVICMVMAAFRHVIPADISTREGKWEKKNFMGRELTGKTIGIIGLGNIGQHIVTRIRGFECKILGFDPLISQSKAKNIGVSLTSVEEIFAKCDVVTLHVPETDETRGMVNLALLSTMKDNAVLVNCAREGIVNEADLREFKQQGTGMMYCTDVYPKDAPGVKSITDCADIMLPHIGANTKEANFNAASKAANQVSDYVLKGVSAHVVNRTCPEGLDPEYQKMAFVTAQLALALLKGNKGQADAQPIMIEATFYGNLLEYYKYLLPSIYLGLGHGDFDPSVGYTETLEALQKKGIQFNLREEQPDKNYGDSMTIDLLSGKGDQYSKVSIRSTLTDGKPMISRINEFDHLYFNPEGHAVAVEYMDTVGVVAAITQVLARYNVNVMDMRVPHNPDSGRSMCLVQVDRDVDRETAKDIEILTRAERCARLSL